MHTYQNLKSKMKGRSPSTWSPASKPKQGRDTPAIEYYGEGLVESASTGEEADSPPINNTVYQSFEWYTPSWSTPATMPTSAVATKIADASAVEITTSMAVNTSVTLPSHYSVITSLLPSLASLGITSIWLPPGCKASNPQDNGYGIYDLFDLGEFDAKNSRATKWGSKEELVQLGQKAEAVDIGLLWDAVLNHRAAADDKERARAIVVSSTDRNKQLSKPYEVRTWSRFTYPARAGLYSAMTYDWKHFSGIDWDDATRTQAVLKFVSDSHSKPGWATDVSSELGNYDYLMFADLDYSQPDVRADVLNWSTWLATQVPGLAGFRLDAIKHYSARFQYSLIKHLRDNAMTKDWFFVGEYWHHDSKMLAKHIDAFAGHMHLFDVKLLYNFHDFSHGRIKDLRTILKGSLVEIRPSHAVTFTTNHDTQATQSLAAPVLPWFHPHTHALTLLRKDGTPTIFHGDIFGTLGPSPTPPSSGNRLMRFSLIRRLYAYGAQYDFFTSHDCIAWSREGHAAHSNGTGIAAVLSSSWAWKAVKVYVGRKHAGEVWTDLMGWSWDEVAVDRNGYGVFRVGPRSVGVWADRNAPGRERVDGLVWPALEAEQSESE